MLPIRCPPGQLLPRSGCCRDKLLPCSRASRDDLLPGPCGPREYLLPGSCGHWLLPGSGQSDRLLSFTLRDHVWLLLGEQGQVQAQG